MAYNPEKIQEYAKVIFDRLNQFNEFTLATIARRIKNTGKLSAYDQQSLKNMADISGDMKVITKKLAEITKLNIDDLENVYSQTVSDGVNTYKPLYDFKNMPFVPFEQNDFAQQLVRHWAMQTAGEMINLSRTKALCFDKYNINGEIIGSTPLQGAFQKAIDSAVTAVSSATTDFNTAMSKTIENLGGSGVRVNYASGVTRSLPAMIRQNLLYAVKQSAKAYDEYVGEQLNCDGFEVDAHPGCRPTHEVIQGQMYAYGYNDITINGITYLSANKDLDGGKSALELLNDYGCLHFTISVILGVSEPRYSKEELAEIENQTKEVIEYEGRQKTLYQWKQTARRMERAVRKKQTQANMFKEAGNNIKAKDFQNEATAIRVKYNEMCEKVGLRPQLDRMQVHKNKPLTNGENGGIININKDTIDFSYPMKGFDNKSIREWYVANVNDIRNRINISKSVEEQARQAFELRIKYRQIARNHMADVETAQMLNKKYPSKSFDELVQDKINRKGLSREQAIEDILKTATKTNADANKEFGL